MLDLKTPHPSSSEKDPVPLIADMVRDACIFGMLVSNMGLVQDRPISKA
jgi:hypothetical protein